MLNKIKTLSNGDKFAVVIMVIAGSLSVGLITLASLINLNLI